jgi:hypothetical protein
MQPPSHVARIGGPAYVGGVSTVALTGLSSGPVGGMVPSSRPTSCVMRSFSPVRPLSRCLVARVPNPSHLPTSQRTRGAGQLAGNHDVLHKRAALVCLEKLKCLHNALGEAQLRTARPVPRPDVRGV